MDEYAGASLATRGPKVGDKRVHSQRKCANKTRASQARASESEYQTPALILKVFVNFKIWKGDISISMTYSADCAAKQSEPRPNGSSASLHPDCASAATYSTACTTYDVWFTSSDDGPDDCDFPISWKWYGNN